MTEPRRARRCPMCGLVNRPSAESCECGHGFDEHPEDLRGLLLARRTIGWAMVGGGLCSTLLSVLVIVLAAGTGILLVLGISMAIASVGLFVKGTRIADATRHRLRELDALPTARLIER